MEESAFCSLFSDFRLAGWRPEPANLKPENL